MGLQNKDNEMTVIYHTHTHTRTHARTHARTHTKKHTHTYTRIRASVHSDSLAEPWQGTADDGSPGSEGCSGYPCSARVALPRSARVG